MQWILCLEVIAEELLNIKVRNSSKGVSMTHKEQLKEHRIEKHEKQVQHQALLKEHKAQRHEKLLNHHQFLKNQKKK